MEIQQATELLVALCPVNGVIPPDLDAETRSLLIHELYAHLDDDDAFIPDWLSYEVGSSGLQKSLFKRISNDNKGSWERGPRGGMRRKVGDKWVYQGKESGGKSKGKTEEQGESSKGPSDDKTANQMQAMASALDKFPSGYKITDPNGVTHTKAKNGRWKGSDGKTRTATAFVEYQTGGESVKVNQWKIAMWTFVQSLVPGNDPHWKVRLEQKEKKKAADAKEAKGGNEGVEKTTKQDDEAPAQTKLEKERQDLQRIEAEHAELRELQEISDKKKQLSAELEQMKAVQEIQGKRQKPDIPKKKDEDKAKKAMLYLDVLETMEQASLEKAFFKGKAVGGKYIRRVPYTDPKTGKRKYRYYYSQSSAARDVQAGEEVRMGDRTVKVVQIDDNGDITLELGSVRKKVTPSQWSDLMARHYGDAYYEHAEKRARQTINAILRHVPRELLEDLKGRTDEARMRDLKKRVPEVYEKLQASFKRAGVTPWRAKDVIAKSLERKGWEPEARALVIGSVVFSRDAAKQAVAHRDIVRASENLAGGDKVEAKHVAAALELRKPRGKGGTFVSKIADVAKAAEREIAKLQTLLKAAKKSKGATAEVAAVLAQAIASTNIAELNMLATAYPGIQDKAIKPSREIMLEVPSVAPHQKPKTNGSETRVFVSGEGGKAKAMKARYVLMEADDVIPSHKPGSFGVHPDYPKGVQERVYHKDKSEQWKVRRNAQHMDGAFVFNTNPDAVNGPPICTPDGVVLGGNSRTMSIQLAYEEHEDKANQLREYMKTHAHEVGFTEEDISAMKKPVLVRVVDPEDKSTENMQLMVRQMNESFTQSMDPRTYQIAVGRKLDQRTMARLANEMREDETLNHFLGTSRANSFIAQLHRIGVIDDRNVNQYMNPKKGTLNSDGKMLVSRILVGKVLPDKDVLADVRPKLLDSIGRSVPSMVQATSYGEKYDLSEAMVVAMSAYNDLISKAENEVIKMPDAKMSDKEFQGLFNYFVTLPGIGKEHPILKDEKAQTMLEVLIRRPGPRQMSGVFREYTKLASKYPEGQVNMFGDGMTPEQVFKFTVKAAIDNEAKEEAAAKQAELERLKKEAEEKDAPQSQDSLFRSMVTQAIRDGDA